MDGCILIENTRYASPEEAEKRCREEIAELEDDVQCLMDHVGNELVEASMKNMIPGAGNAIPAETMQAIVYIAEESYNLTCTDKYGPPPPNLDEMCKEENRGMCSGSLLLCIFLGLAALTILFRGRRSK